MTDTTWFDRNGILILTAAYTVLTLGILVATAWAAKVQKNAAVANLLTTFLQQYSTKQMDDDLKRLRAFYDDSATRNILYSLSALTSDPCIMNRQAEDAARYYMNHHEQELGEARRNVDFYFERAYRLHQRGYLPKWEFLLIANTSAKQLLLDVVRPLSLAVSLIKLHDGNWDTYRSALTGYEWYRDFEKRAAWRPELIIDPVMRWIWGLFSPFYR